MTVKIFTSDDELSTTQVFEAEKVDHHERIQRGNLVICLSCPNQHAEYIKPGYVLGKRKDGTVAIMTIEEEAMTRVI